MAQKIEFRTASNLNDLEAEFAAIVARYAVDPNYIVTPVGFTANALDGYVLAVSVDATHKRIFQEPEPGSVYGAAGERY